MDNTESDQEASTPSSTEDTPRQVDLRALGSPTYRPLSPVQIERSPPEETEEEFEEVEWESQEPETPDAVTPRRRIWFATPIAEPISPLPFLSPPEEERQENMAAAADVATLETRLAALEALLAAPATTVLTNPDDFQPSPYDARPI